VWQDQRFGATAIIGSRIDFTGTNIDDPRGVNIAIDGSQPDVAFDGTNYIVVYRGAGGSDGSDILARRVSATGAVIDTTPLVVDAGAGSQSVPRVAFDGANYMFVWYDSGGNMQRIRARAMGANGVFIGNAVDVSMGPTTSSKFAPAIAASPGKFLITWQEQRIVANANDIFARTLTAAGALGAELNVTNTTFDETQPAVAWNGTTFLLAFTSTTATTAKDILARRLTSNGATTGNILAVTAITGDQTHPRVAALTAGTTDFLVAFVDETSGTTFDVRAGRVSSAGVALDTVLGGGFAVATGATTYEQEPATCAMPNGEFAVVYSETAPITVSTDVWIKSVSDATGSLSSFVSPVTGGVNRQLHSSVARGSNGYLLAWEDNRGGAPGDLYGMRLDANGTPSDTPMTLQTGGNYPLHTPKVVHAGTQYVVAWESASSLYVRAFNEADGSPVGAASMVVSGGGNSLAQGVHAGSNGTDVLLTYYWLTGTLEARAMLLAGGTTAGSPIDLQESALPGTPVATATGWLVPSVGLNGKIQVVRLAADGSLVDAIMFDDITETVPVVAVIGDAALIAWAADGGTVHVKRIDLTTGTVGATTAILGGGGSYVNSIAITQGTALVTWEQMNDDIVGARIDATTLARVDATDVVLAGGAFADQDSSLAIDAAGAGVLAWTRMDTTASVNAQRVLFATLSGLALPADPDGAPDAGMMPDGGGGGGGPGLDDEGGGGCCQANGSSVPLLPALLVAAGMLVWRRRR
jgi:hypothetical protein